MIYILFEGFIEYKIHIYYCRYTHHTYCLYIVEIFSRYVNIYTTMKTGNIRPHIVLHWYANTHCIYFILIYIKCIKYIYIDARFYIFKRV